MSRRNESPMLRSLRQRSLDAQMRPFDGFAMVLGYALLIGVAMFGLVTIAVALDDWALGQPADLLAQVSAALAALDGVR